MPWVNQNTKEQLLERPTRIRLDDASTRTHDAISDEDLAELGWVWEDHPPVVNYINPNNTTTYYTTSSGYLG